MLVITDELVKGLIDRLERQGQSKEYVDGVLEGVSWTLELYRSLVSIEKNKEKWIRQEHDVAA